MRTTHDGKPRPADPPAGAVTCCAALIAAQPPCPGRMTARVKPDLDRLPDLVCDHNPAHTVPPATWQRLGWKANARSERGLKALLERTKR